MTITITTVAFVLTFFIGWVANVPFLIWGLKANGRELKALLWLVVINNLVTSSIAMWSLIK